MTLDLCDCTDKGCAAHKGKAFCKHKAITTLYRIDCEDLTGTDMCDDCSIDAMASGVFADEPGEAYAKSCMPKPEDITEGLDDKWIVFSYDSDEEQTFLDVVQADTGEEARDIIGDLRGEYAHIGGQYTFADFERLREDVAARNESAIIITRRSVPYWKGEF